MHFSLITLMILVSPISLYANNDFPHENQSTYLYDAYDNDSLYLVETDHEDYTCSTSYTAQSCCAAKQACHVRRYSGTTVCCAFIAAIAAVVTTAAIIIAPSGSAEH